MILCDAHLARKIDSAVFPGGQGGPLMHVIAAKAVGFLEAARPSFKDYCAQVLANARALCDGLMESGHTIVSGGTDTHLFLLSLMERDTPVRRRRSRWSGPASAPTRTWCRSTHASRW
jgi:glycine hydroxymethyltransferase